VQAILIIAAIFLALQIVKNLAAPRNRTWRIVAMSLVLFFVVGIASSFGIAILVWLFEWGAIAIYAYAAKRGFRLSITSHSPMVEGVDSAKPASGIRGWWRRQQQLAAATQRRAARERLLNPSVACSSLNHKSYGSGILASGIAYRMSWRAVVRASAANSALRRLSFYDVADTFALVDAVEAVLALGQKLDAIDASIIKATGSH
jgi:hypothetical protein